MNGSHIAIPTILKVGKGTLKDIGSYIKDSRIENVWRYCSSIISEGKY